MGRGWFDEWALLVEVKDGSGGWRNGFGMVCVNGSGVLEAGDGVVVGAGVKIVGGYGAVRSLLVFRIDVRVLEGKLREILDIYPLIRADQLCSCISPLSPYIV
jgi:hypothetical protein